MANSKQSIAPKRPRGVHPVLRDILRQLDSAHDESLLKTYAERSYVGSVLFVPYLLSEVWEKLEVDLFGVCFALGLRGKAASDKYRETRDYLDTYCKGEWLESFMSRVQIEEFGKIQAPVIKKKPKGRDDIAGFAVNNVFKVPRYWRYFLRTHRVSYKFRRPLIRSTENQLCAGVSAAVLQSNSKLFSYAKQHLSDILKSTSELLNCYKFIPELPRPDLQRDSERFLPQLAAFCLFIYGDWSGYKKVIRVRPERTSLTA